MARTPYIVNPIGFPTMGLVGALFVHGDWRGCNVFDAKAIHGISGIDGGKKLL